MLYCNKLTTLCSAIGFTLFTAHVSAAMIPTGFDITASLETTTNDVFALQTTTGTATEGGAAGTPSDMTGAAASLNATFSDTSDGLSFTGSVSGNSSDGVTYDAFGNYFLLDAILGMDNTTSDDYRIVWDFTYSLLADADGVDAFAESSMNGDDGTSSLFNELLISDLFFGDQVGQGFPGTSGDTLSTSGSTTFTFDVLAGNDATLNGNFGLGGGVYDVDSQFLSSLDFGFSIRSIEQINVTNPPPVPTPEPFTPALMLLGLAVLLRNRNT